MVTYRGPPATGKRYFGGGARWALFPVVCFIVVTMC